MHLYVHCSIIYNRQDMETIQMSINGWMDNIYIIYLYIIIYYYYIYIIYIIKEYLSAI